MSYCLIGFTADLDGYDNGYADGFSTETNVDGSFDYVEVDTNEDGYGYVDGTGHDVNQDGQIDFTDGVDDKFV